MDEKESLARVYYEKIQELGSAGNKLNDFYTALFDLNAGDEDRIKRIIMFNRFVKLYGKRIVFDAILDLQGFQDINHDKIQFLLSYLCRKKFHEETPQPSNIFDTREIENKLQKKKLKVTNPFEEGENSGKSI